MPTDKSTSYFKAREVIELQRAAASTSPKIHDIHRELADRYAQRIIGPLGGKRILIVEDEYLIADEVSTVLQEEGAEIIGPVGQLSEACEHAVSSTVDFAVVDVGLHGEMAFDLLDVLSESGVPILLLTGYDREVLPARHRGLNYTKNLHASAQS